MTVDEAVNAVRESLNAQGITKLLSEAKPEDRDEIVRALMNIFGARMP